MKVHDLPTPALLVDIHAFDRNVLGVRPDLRFEVRLDVLEEVDGPMLEHGLQGFHGAVLTVPRAEALQPNREFLAERYDPAHVELAGLYDPEPGDVGMHFLCAPADTPVHGFTRAVITTVMAWLFADPATRRVVVEPDVRNTAVHALNAAVGFTVVGPIRKPEKEALLSVCTRDQFRAATGAPTGEEGAPA